MKQVYQSLRTGEIGVSEVPVPGLKPGYVLVQVATSLISPGTERMAVGFGRKNLLDKARDRPDLVRQVLNRARKQGVLTTIEKVRNRLDQPAAVGYACAGTVIGVGEDVATVQVGDSVACGGAGDAVHAEVVSVPKNLVVKLPNGVDFESAAFTTLGATSIHAVRLSEPQMGESIAVIGLGLVGLLTFQLARAAGCAVVGMDPDPERCRLADQLGCEATATDETEFAHAVARTTSGRGADGVIICAATPSDGPVELAGQVARQRAIVVALGLVGTRIPRRTYYDKELTFRVSRSYGPGRYDREYEEKGHDYPIGFVRWTENRNMQAFVQLLADDKIDVARLTTHRFPVEEAQAAYELVTGKSRAVALGILLTYSPSSLSRRIELVSGARRAPASRPRPVAAGLLGGGQFATTTLLPAMKRVSGIELVGVCNSTGLRARHVADKFGFNYCATQEEEIVNDPEVNTVVVATRHHLHARQVVASLAAGKSVFCEKPLALEEDELHSIVEAAGTLTTNMLMVGYNRRFSAMGVDLRAFLSPIQEPLAMHYRVNAGRLPADHWVHDPGQGGDRIRGEVCHFVDFLTFLAGALPVRVEAEALNDNGLYRQDNLTITMRFASGSLGTITYVANGDESLPKERVEVFGGGAAAVLDDFRRLELIRNGRKKVHRSRLRQDKGFVAEWEAFVDAMKVGSASPISLQETVSATLTTLRILDSLRTGGPVEVDVPRFIASPSPADIK